MSRPSARLLGPGASRTASLETAIMDLSDAGVPTRAIAEQLQEPFGNVRRIEGYMRETTPERTFARETRLASQRLAAAVAATGRTYA